MARRKTWREKLANDKDLPKVVEMDGRRSKKWGEGTCVIPAPREVDALMQRVPEGRLATIDVLREALALQHEATIACPLTTGIFAWIAAHAAEESEADGDGESTPYWRTLKARGELNPKYPGGLDALSKRLKAEGHSVTTRGNKRFVADYESALVSVDELLKPRKSRSAKRRQSAN